MPNPYLSALNSLDTSPLGVPGAGVGTWEDGPWLRRRQGLFGCHQSQSRPSRCPLTRLQLISNETSGAKKELRKSLGIERGGLDAKQKGLLIVQEGFCTLKRGCVRNRLHKVMHLWLAVISWLWSCLSLRTRTHVWSWCVHLTANTSSLLAWTFLLCAIHRYVNSVGTLYIVPCQSSHLDIDRNIIVTSHLYVLSYWCCVK